MNGELVTAIIPTYNYARFVSRAVESVLSQSYSPIECVVVNDGSTDNTLDILRPYQERVRIITQTNQGLSAARNTGIAAAQGRFLALLDADDWWHPEKITRQMQGFARNEAVAAVGCGEYLVDGNDKVFGVRVAKSLLPCAQDNLRAVALRRRWVGASGSGILIRKSIMDRVGDFDEGLSAAEDWDMWLRLVAQHHVVNLPDLLISRGHHGTGVFRNVQRMETNQWRVYEKAIQAWPEVLTPIIRRQMRALILADAGGECVGNGDIVQAVKKYRRSLREWPLDGWRWYKVVRLLMRRRKPASVTEARQ